MGDVSKCPVMHGAVTSNNNTGTSNRDWWPNQLNLNILRQQDKKSDPMDDSFEYREEFIHGRTPATSTFFAIYFALKGVHSININAGVIVNKYHWFSASKLFKSNPEKMTNRIEIAGLYWHFVDLVWIFLFPVLYLL